MSVYIDESHEEAEARLKSGREHEGKALEYARLISQLYSYRRASLQDTQNSWHMFSRLNSAFAISAWKLKKKDYEYIDWIRQYASDVHDKLKITYESLKGTCSIKSMEVSDET